MDMVLVTPVSKVWNLHFYSCAEQEENFIDFRGELKHLPEPKHRNIIDKRDYINYCIHDVEYEASINAVIYDNGCEPVLSQTSDFFL